MLHAPEFSKAGLSIEIREQYYSISHERVLRGLHFQVPPRDCVKLVYCVAGSVFDVVLDLRIGSPTFGRHFTLQLSAEAANALYLSKGLAHGFYVPQGEATLIYNTSEPYSREHDCGILWNSAGIQWPVANPITSPRDRGLPAWTEFKSPFVYEE